MVSASFCSFHSLPAAMGKKPAVASRRSDEQILAEDKKALKDYVCMRQIGHVQAGSMAQALQTPKASAQGAVETSMYVRPPSDPWDLVPTPRNFLQTPGNLLQILGNLLQSPRELLSDPREPPSDCLWGSLVVILLVARRVPFFLI